MCHRAHIYGLLIDSVVALPDAKSDAGSNAAGRADLEITYAPHGAHADRVKREPIRQTVLPGGAPWMTCWRVRGGFVLSFEQYAEFFVNSPGTHIELLSPRDSLDGATLGHLILDQVVPYVLNLRGHEALHATAVLTPAGACAFVGPAGSGKSTLAASFLLAGYPSLGDDCLVLDTTGPIKCFPAYPGLRLWDDAAAALGVDFGDSAPVASYTSKRRMLASMGKRDFPRTAQPLARVYRLVWPQDCAAAPAIEALSPRDAVMELIAASFPLDLADSAMLERHFRTMARVANAVPMRRLSIPRSHGALDAVREIVLGDLRAS